MALAPRQKRARRLWKMRALGLGYEDGGGGGGGGGGGTLTEQVVAFFGGGEEGGVWDFTDATNLATATDGTGAVSNGSLIAYAADLSGNLNHLTQATSGSRPTWNSAGYADFVSDWMTVNWTATAQPITRVSRTYEQTYIPSGTSFRIFAGGAATNRALLFKNNSDATQAVMNAGASAAGQTVGLDAYRSFVEVYNGASSNFRINGTDNTVNAGTGNVGGLTVCANFDGTSPHPGMRVVRVLMIDRELTAGEIATAEAWAEEVL